MPGKNNAWRCSVCGYIHRGSEPPDPCPVCGASRDEFEPYADPAQPSVEPEVEQWRCLVCKYLHAGPTAPELCPVCGAPANGFEPLTEVARKTAQAGQAAKVVIVGAGIAGIAAVESLREASLAAEITLISKEPSLPYYRLNLTRYLAGEIDQQDLPIHPESWYRRQNVRFLLGTEVSAVHPEDRSVEIPGGQEWAFEKLLLATGAHPFIPPFPGVRREGVTCLRTVEDADYLLEACSGGVKCVCIGGGLLGLETAGALARRGADVTLLEGHGWLLPRQLNQTAGEILAAHVAGTGIKLHRQARTREILGDQRVHGVLLEDESTIPADLVVIATGIRPNSCLARRAGLEVDQGVVVDNALRTSHPDVFAAGDVAEHRGTVYGTWGPSQYQAGIAGLNMVGIDAEFGGIPQSNTLKVLGLDLFSIGRITPEDASCDAIDQEIDGRYFRFVFRDSRLVGAILLGDTKLTAALKKAVESKQDFSGLLQKRPSAQELLDYLEDREQMP